VSAAFSHVVALCRAVFLSGLARPTFLVTAGSHVGEMMKTPPAGLIARAGSWEVLSRSERRQTTRALRASGLSYGEIQSYVPVAKSTLSGWVADVALSDSQLAAIELRRKEKHEHRDTQWRRRLEIKEIRADARMFALEHLEDPFFVAGVCLYWGEGAKTRNRCSLTNSDPAILRMFINWVRTYLDLQAEMVLAIHLHADNDETAAREYWATATGLVGNRFTKTFTKPDGTGHRKNHLPYGVCRVRVMRPADHWNRVMEWIEVVADHLGSPRSEIVIIPAGR